jgi:phage gp36-like protein
MGRYIGWEDVTNTYPSVAKDRGAEDTSLGIIIRQAEGECDAAVAPRYTTPFVPGSVNCPEIVRTLAVDIVYWRLNIQQDWAKDLRKDILDRFKRIVDGDVSLVNSSGVLNPSGSPQAWTSTAYRSSFGPDEAPNWSVSQAWLDDAEDERSGD